MTSRLSVVTDETKPPRKVAATITAAVAMDERDLLVTMRRRVATEIDGGVPAHTLAPLMRQLRDMDKEIRALDAREEQEASRSGPTEDETWTAI